MAHANFTSWLRLTQSVVFVSLLSLAAASCYVWRADTDESIADAIANHGHALRVTRTDGSRIVLVHPAIIGDSLSGVHVVGTNEIPMRIPLTDVRQVEGRVMSSGRTIALGAATAGIVGAVVVVQTQCTGCSC
jgi:hypothetical protein